MGRKNEILQHNREGGKRMKDIKINEKAVLSVKEVMAYTGFGENAVREMLNNPNCTFVIRHKSRLMCNKKMLDKYLDSISGK